MAEKEYIISLKRGVDYEAFDDEMQAGIGRGLITDRTVDIANARPLSQRNTHYMLEEAEVTELLKDERVLDIQEPPENRDDLQIGTQAVQTGTWRKTSAITSSDLNWGMLRATTREDVWGSGVTSSTRPFNYNLTGKGVDVVIQDTGIDTGHVEFTDANGVSRVKPIDWFSASGVSGTQGANHYRDYDGHGTHVASTVAGRSLGWAKDAHIYAIKINGLQGVGDDGQISVSNCFDIIKGWHNNKSVDPTTGLKRPTIVNMSWGYTSTLSNTPTSGTFRGGTWNYGDSNFASDANLRDNAGIIGKIFSSGTNRKIPLRITSVDTDIQELIDAGIHVCISSGNSYYYTAAEGDQDWDNRVVINGVTYYYHRGGSPYDTEAFMVGSLDITYQGGKEHKSEFSNCGPGVDIYAPGNNIMGASSDDSSGTNDMVSVDGYTRVASPLNGSQWLMKVSGTSMASPNLCGMLATVLESSPGMTPAALKEWTHNNSTKNMMYQGTKDNWDDYDSINCGGTTDYQSKSIVESTEMQPLSKHLDVRGVRLLAWGAKGGATAVSDSFIQKVARHYELMLDPTGADIDATAQAAAIAGMKQYNVGQFIGHTSGASYSPSILADNSNNFYPGLDIIRNSFQNVDFIWEYDDTGGSYSANSQVLEIMEHALHTLTVYALPAAYPTQFAQNNQTSALYDACAQAITNNVFDASSYGTWPGTDADVRALIMREYYYLLTLGMWEYFSVFVDGGSLSPEWNDNSRTQAGIQTNNSLGYALYNDYGKKILAKPSQTILTAMHTASAASGYAPNANTNRIMYTPYATPATFSTTVWPNAVAPSGASFLETNSIFSTSLYAGNGATQTITNGVNLNGEGGLVWIKDRTSANGHRWTTTNFTSSNPALFAIQCLTTNGQNNMLDYQDGITQWNNNGFKLEQVSGSGGSGFNINGNNYVSWTFRKAPRFFDIVSYTGDTNSQQVLAHNLDSDPGMVIIKSTNTNGTSWWTWHRSFGANTSAAGKQMALDSVKIIRDTGPNYAGSAFDWSSPNGAYTQGSYLQGTSRNNITVGYEANNNTWQYEAYLFAHNDGDGGFGTNGDLDIIKCGSYTGNGLADGPTVDLGWQPQWVLIKKTASGDSGNWYIFDSVRGVVTGSNDQYLSANATDIDQAASLIDFTNTGFKITQAGNAGLNNGGIAFIYTAIRAA